MPVGTACPALSSSNSRVHAWETGACLPPAYALGGLPRPTRVCVEDPSLSAGPLKIDSLGIVGPEHLQQIQNIPDYVYENPLPRYRMDHIIRHSYCTYMGTCVPVHAESCCACLLRPHPSPARPIHAAVAGKASQNMQDELKNKY